jgi:hypothetical protein
MVVNSHIVDFKLIPRPGRFDPRKEVQYTLYKTLGGPQTRSGLMRKMPPLPEFDPGPPSP